MAILLGKTATVTCGGVSAGARDVTMEETVSELEFGLYANRQRYSYSAGYTGSATIEFIDDGATGLISNLQTGEQISVSISPGGFSFNAIVTGVTQSMPLDGAISWTVNVKLTYPGLR